MLEARERSAFFSHSRVKLFHSLAGEFHSLRRDKRSERGGEEGKEGIWARRGDGEVRAAHGCGREREKRVKRAKGRRKGEFLIFLSDILVSLAEKTKKALA